jgi:hypothetical protein
MSDEPKKRDGKRLGRWLTLLSVVVALPLLYVISIGPAIWFSDRGIIQKSVVASIYAPVYWVYERGPVSIQSGMDWYVELWSKKRDKGIIFDPVPQRAH